jgi:hypothetical protein
LGSIQPPFSAPLGATETQMLNTGEFYWGQTRPATIPSAVCVKHGNARDAYGNLVPVFLPQGVTDEVTVSQALYDPAAKSLTVAASSSDETLAPVMQLTYPGVSAPLAGGQIVVPNVLTPPSKVFVLSAASGSSERQVSTTVMGAAPPGAPAATADAYTFAEDSGAHILAVLANDLNAAGGVVTLSSAPSFGTAVVNADGTVTYTSNPNANGADSFTYTVTAGSQVSGTATVSLSINPVNDAPVAVDDAATVNVNTPIQINVLGNDTDPDGAADLYAAVSLSASSPAGASISGGAGGIVTFSATAAGTYTFTYRAQDTSLSTSANTGRVTVTVAAAEAISINRNQYTVRTRKLVVEGNVTPAGNQTVTVEFLNNAGTVLGKAGSVVAVGGRFKLNATVSLPAGAARIRATTPAGAVSPSVALTLK